MDASQPSPTPSDNPGGSVAVATEKRLSGLSPGLLAGSHHVAAMIETMTSNLARMQKEVHAVEERQIISDRRLAELHSLIQGLQEEQLEQACSLERGQKTVAMRAKHALHTAVAVQQHVVQSDHTDHALDQLSVPPGSWAAQAERRFEARFEEQRKWLTELTSEINAMHGQRPRGNLGGFMTHSQVHLSLSAGGQQPLSLTDRVVALERSQKAVTVSAKRALHTAMVVHQQQKTAEQENELQKALGFSSGPLGVLEEQWTLRYNEQNQTIDRLIEMVQDLNEMTDKADAKALENGARGGVFSRAASRTRSASRGRSPVDRVIGAGFSVPLQQQVEALSKKVEEMESAVMFSLASQQGPSHQIKPVDASNDMTTKAAEGIMVALQNLERKFDKSVVDLSDNLSSLQAVKDQQALALRGIMQQLPDMKSRLDQMWSHTQHLLERVRDHDVRFEVGRSSMDGQKQELLDVSDYDHLEWMSQHMTEEDMEKRFEAFSSEPISVGNVVPSPPLYTTPLPPHERPALQERPQPSTMPPAWPAPSASDIAAMRARTEQHSSSVKVVKVTVER